MKYKLLIFISLILLFGISCEENNSLNDTCKEVEETFWDNELKQREIRFFKNGYLERNEYLNGDVIEYEYDNLGNETLYRRIFADGYQNTTIKKYDALNNLIRQEYYKSGILQSTQISNYNGYLIDTYYFINSNNDTTSWQKYNYENGILRTRNSSYGITYYYYTADIDSTVSYDNDQNIRCRTKTKTINSNIVHSESYEYIASQMQSYTIKDFEYDGQVLNRKVERSWSLIDPSEIYIEERYVYEKGRLDRIEVYFEPESLHHYDKYIYNENEILSKIEQFDINGGIVLYKLFNGNCN